MARPILHVFAISHFCEKARFALDFLGVDHAIRHLTPVAHMKIARELGAPGTSLPILVTDDGVIQGSADIIDWADASGQLRVDAPLEDQCRAIERRLDEVVGVHVRRYFYSETLVEHPDTLRPIFSADLTSDERRSFEESWDGVRRLMVGAMDLGFEQGLDSRRIIAGELDWVDGLLADGRRHLLGDRFSRADISAASLLAPLARPEEHPTHGIVEIPPRSRVDLAEWADRPSLAWVREIYRAHR